MKQILKSCLIFIFIISAESCYKDTPETTVKKFLTAPSLRDSKVYLLNRKDGELLKNNKHNLFLKNGKYKILKSKIINNKRVAVLVSGIFIAGFIDPKTTVAIQTVKTPNGWKIDLTRTLLDPKLQLINKQKNKYKKKQIQKAIEIIRRACIYYNNHTKVWPKTLTELKQKTPYGIPEKIAEYKFEITGGGKSEPIITAKPITKTKKLPSYESTVIGKIKEIPPK